MIIMKIISGKYKGRVIKGFDVIGTRPTMDRVRESLFATIQNYLKDATILDLFAGTGSLGLEAISNGAKKAIFVDKNKICINNIKEAISKINIEEEIKLINKDYIDALKEVGKVDIIFLDPPYHENILNKAIKKIEELDILNENGLIIAEFEEEKPICNYKLLKEKKYGDKYISIYKKA